MESLSSFFVIMAKDRYIDYVSQHFESTFLIFLKECELSYACDRTNG